MKIIFLDIDGVLNHSSFYKNLSPDKEDKPYPLSEIDPVCVMYLNDICAQSGAKVVVSSTWRHGRTIGELQNILNKCGFRGEIIDVTPCLDKHGRWVQRGNEIWEWIQNNEFLLKYECYFSYNTYVILDDDIDMLYRQKNNFIHVNSLIGLTPGNVTEALRMLNRINKIK